MKITTLVQVNERARDGRVYAAGEGTTRIVPDDDKDMVDLMRAMAAKGVVTIEEPEPEPEPEPEVSEVEQSPADQTNTDVAQADDALAVLRAEAITVGVKVDKRWGVDRLREEIASLASGDDE